MPNNLGTLDPFGIPDQIEETEESLAFRIAELRERLEPLAVADALGKSNSDKFRELCKLTPEVTALEIRLRDLKAENIRKANLGVTREEQSRSLTLGYADKVESALKHLRSKSTTAAKATELAQVLKAYVPPVLAELARLRAKKATGPYEPRITRMLFPDRSLVAVKELRDMSAEFRTVTDSDEIIRRATAVLELFRQEVQN